MQCMLTAVVMPRLLATSTRVVIAARFTHMGRLVKSFIHCDPNIINMWRVLTVLFSAQFRAVFDHEMTEWLMRLERHRLYDSWMILT